MPMILKIMLRPSGTKDGYPDDCPSAEYHIYEGVASVRFTDPPSDTKINPPPYAQACVTFSNGGGERFSVPSTAYLMNENGKTISTYTAPPRLDVQQS